MFTPINSHSATNDVGVTISVGRNLQYRHGERVLEMSAQLCPPLDADYGALFNIYYPARPQWKAPYHDEYIDSDTGRRIERDIIEALHVLDCGASFTLPVERV